MDQLKIIYQLTNPWTSPYDTGAHTNIWQRERSGTQGRAPQALTFWSMNTISAEQNTMKDQENSMHATEVCEHAMKLLYNNLICQWLTMLHKGSSMQRHNQQVLAKPCHNPSDRDQQAREKLQQKAKIKS